MTGIQWTDETWNPVVGCTPVSPGCLNCYAARTALRLRGMGTRGYRDADDPKGVRIAEVKAGRAVFTGSVRCVEKALALPLKRGKPTKFFIASMGDLFHESVPLAFVDRVFAVMALCPQHTFQVLTKRPERVAEYLNTGRRHYWINKASLAMCGRAAIPTQKHGMVLGGWPLPNVWLGTSAENQRTLDERVPHLLRCPGVLFLSCEPLLEAVGLRLRAERPCSPSCFAHITHPCERCGYQAGRLPIDWIIVGGESGPGARACNVEWVRSVVRQGREAGVPVFVKQLGARVVVHNDSFSEWPDDGDGLIYDDKGPGWSYQGELVEVRLHDSHGGDPAEWPEDLRVREMPSTPEPSP